MKGKCPQCGEIVSLPDAPPAAPVIVKEPCDCGATEVTRCLKYSVLGIVSLVLAFLGGCWLDNYYALESVKAMPDRFKMVPTGPGPGPGYRVEPKAEPKAEPK